MKIIKASKDFTMAERYALTKSPRIHRMSDMVGNEIEVASWLIYEDEKPDGNTVTILSILDPEGEAFATNSPTFIHSFSEVVDMAADAGETVHEIDVYGGTSKNGRAYLDCVYIR